MASVKGWGWRQQVQSFSAGSDCRPWGQQGLDWHLRLCSAEAGGSWAPWRGSGGLFVVWAKADGTCRAPWRCEPWSAQWGHLPLCASDDPEPAPQQRLLQVVPLPLTPSTCVTASLVRVGGSLRAFVFRGAQRPSFLGAASAQGAPPTARGMLLGDRR